jgi:hypothetical protein
MVCLDGRYGFNAILLALEPPLPTVVVEVVVVVGSAFDFFAKEGDGGGAITVVGDEDDGAGTDANNAAGRATVVKNCNNGHGTNKRNEPNSISTVVADQLPRNTGTVVAEVGVASLDDVVEVEAVDVGHVKRARRESLWVNCKPTSDNPIRPSATCCVLSLLRTRE